MKLKARDNRPLEETISLAENGITLAIVPTDDVLDAGKAEDLARMLAAAPELLETLQTLSSCWAVVLEDSKVVNSATEGQRVKYLLEARALIARLKKRPRISKV